MTAENVSGDAGVGFALFGRMFANERAAIVSLVDILRVEEEAAGVAIGAWIETCRTPWLRGGLRWIAERESFHGRVFTDRMRALGAECSAVVDLSRGADYQACLADPNVADSVKLGRLAGAVGNAEIVIAPVVAFAARITEDLETKEALRLYCEDELSTGRWLCEACARMGVPNSHGVVSQAA